MNDTALAISRIRMLLDRVKPEKIQEVEAFVEFLTEKDGEIAQWIGWHNAGRPHKSSGFKSPREYRVQQRTAVA